MATGLGNGRQDLARELWAVLEGQYLQLAVSAAGLVLVLVGGIVIIIRIGRWTMVIPSETTGGIAIAIAIARSDSGSDSVVIVAVGTAPQGGQQQDVDVNVREAPKTLQGQFSERGQHRGGKKVVEVVGGQLVSDVPEDQRTDLEG